MNTQIQRQISESTVAIATSAALSNAIDYRGFAMGGLITPSALEATTKIGYKVATTANGTYTPLYSSSNALVETTVALDASRAYPFPDELSGWAFFKLWTEASGSDVAQTAARTFQVVMKG